MAGARANGNGKTNGETVAMPKPAAKSKAKAIEVDKPTKGKKRALEEDEEMPDAEPTKKVKTAPKKPAAKKAVAPRKIAAPKKAAASKKAVPKKAVAKTDASDESEDEEVSKQEGEEVEEGAEVDEKDAAEEKEKSATPAPTKAEEPVKQDEKICATHAHIKSLPKLPMHKIGVAVNDVPTQKLDVYVFGEGSSGELGLTSKKDENDRQPIDVKRPRLNPYLASATVGIVKIAVGGMHCAALSHDNKIYTWGVNDQGALGRDTAWDGGVRDMDDEDSDDAEMNPRESTPTVVDSKWFPAEAIFTDICASDSATFVVTQDGRVYGWGTFRNNEGILGFSEAVEVQYKPVLIPQLTKITTMAAGANHILALNNKGKVYAWGSGQQNQLGRRVVERNSLAGLVPREFGLKGQVTKIACGSYHSFAIDSKGTVFSWGLNSFGETGVAFDEDEAYLLKPTVVTALKDKGVTDIDGGAHHSIACTDSGDVLVWGRCDGGQAGIDLDDVAKDTVVLDDKEKPKTILVPTKVDEIEEEVSMVNAENDNCFAVTKDGKVYSWGFSGNYQTGQGNDDDVEIATLIDNTAVRNKQILAAYAGGQFSVLVGKSE